MSVRLRRLSSNRAGGRDFRLHIYDFILMCNRFRLGLKGRRPVTAGEVEAAEFAPDRGQGEWGREVYIRSGF